ncbi:hypothetical protein C0Q70_14666 [Pomacea canaliculata]|uniref:15-oxoprostaglandin 13-reductase n=1 Tax=Pomacea canaliculata TaxID=400727 RepID=A0A2T7NSR8_POMCA|nr:hypothetical protein C0Q70_14666 [Pomacea canaliculata]
MTTIAKKWTLAKQFDGEPKVSDFKLVDEELSTALTPGAILLEALYLTVDPYMRIREYKIGDTLFGEQIARVKVSNNPNFPEGALVLAFLGWRSHTLVPHPEEEIVFGLGVRLLPDFGDLSPSLGIGCLGLTGLTAYFGLLDRGNPKPGETLLVSGAAGAVGSIVGQIGKIKGLKVIGSAGSRDKCEWLKEVGFDHVFNYKERTVDEALKEFAPEGVDLYFDNVTNVGGDFAYDVMKKRSTKGFIIYKQLTILGIMVIAYTKRFTEGVTELLQWVKEGKLQYKETITDGFENMPSAFISLFRGGNTGKAVVKA